jgi:autotransporter translocation and assembly factor TamB
VADLVDTLELRRLRLGAAFQSRFLDSLTIRNLDFTVDQDFWLRSNEANVQLVGSVIVNKLRRRYRVDGSLNTPRGTYSLKIGPVVREFAVQSGVVRYFGTPDLNADIDITATHEVRSTEVGGEDVTVTARIGGTILVPRLQLSTDIRPEIPERDIIGLLILGRLGGGPGNTSDALSVRAGLAYLSGVLSSELSRALIAEGGLPLDMIEIRAPFDAGRESFAGGPTQLVAGRALGRKWFVTLNAGFCSDWSFAARNFGASLEYRLNREWRAQVSAEPGQI